MYTCNREPSLPYQTSISVSTTISSLNIITLSITKKLIIFTAIQTIESCSIMAPLTHNNKPLEPQPTTYSTCQCSLTNTHFQQFSSVEPSLPTNMYFSINDNILCNYNPFIYKKLLFFYQNALSCFLSICFDMLFLTRRVYRKQPFYLLRYHYGRQINELRLSPKPFGVSYVRSKSYQL